MSVPNGEQNPPGALPLHPQSVVSVELNMSVTDVTVGSALTIVMWIVPVAPGRSSVWLLVLANDNAVPMLNDCVPATR